MGFLSSIGKTLFGSEPKTKIKNRSTLSPEQRQILQSLVGPLTQNPESAAQPSQTLQVAPLSNLEGLSLQAIEDQVLAQASGQGGSGKARETIENVIDAGPQDFEDYYKRTVEDPAVQDFDDFLDRTSRRHANTFFSSERIGNEREGREDLLDALTRERARLAFESRESALDRNLEAAGMLPNLDANDMNILLASLEAGGVPRGIEQARHQADRDEFLRQRDAVEKRIQDMINALGIQTNENIAVQSGGSEGLVGGFLGGPGGAALGKAAATKFLPALFTSDRRVKEDVVDFGPDRHGLNMYKFRYRWDKPDVIRVGYMAQDVQEKYPDAIETMETPDGDTALGINYTRLAKWLQ